MTGAEITGITPGPAGTVEVVPAVAAVMDELPAIGKADKSPEGYAYRGIEAITGQLQALLAKHQVLTVPGAEVLSTAPSPAMKDGWQDVLVRVEWLIVGPDGSHLRAVTNGIGRDRSDKGANKAQTQAYKYLLLALLCIADRKDDADGHTYESGRAGLPDGHVWASDAKKSVLSAVGGDRDTAVAAWSAAGLEGREHVSGDELAAALEHADRLLTPAVDEGKRAHDDARARLTPKGDQ